MNCTDFESQVDALLDGELDALHSGDLEAHARECAACAATLHARRTLQSALQNPQLAFPAPAALRQKFAVESFSPLRSLRLWRAGAIAAALLLAASLVTQFASRQGRHPAEMPLAQEAVASHIRSLLAAHLEDVASTDQHTVKPWFAGKLDFSPPVPDLAQEGFPLIGGRLDYLHNRPVAALIYKRRAHTINLFIWPASDHVALPPDSTDNGYSIHAWSNGTMNFVAVSDVSPADLTQLAALFPR